MPSCALQSDIDVAFAAWLTEFGGGGCEVIGVFDENSAAPLSCGGITEVTWRLVNSANNEIIDFCTRSFEVVADNVGPVCPTDWDVTITADMDICVLPAFANVGEISALTGEDVTDNCSAESEISLSYSDFLVPEFCDVLGGFFEERQVERTYVFTDDCGNQSSCVQVITYEFDQCVALDNFGSIGVDGAEEIFVPAGCCLLYTSPSPRDQRGSRMPSSA